MNLNLTNLTNFRWCVVTGNNYNKMVSPIQFVKGDLSILQTKLPLSLYNGTAQTGFIQFGAETMIADYFAMCPGIK